MKWEKKKLGDLIDLYDNMRIPLSGIEREKRKGEFPYYGAQSIIDYVNEYIFDGNYILIAEDGENLRTRNQPIAFSVSGQFWVNNHAHIVKGKKDISDDLFIKYFLNDIDINPYVTGAAQPKLSQKNLKEIVINTPPFHNQRRIASILAAYDDLIENNLKRIKLLEEEARIEYKSIQKNEKLYFKKGIEVFNFNTGKLNSNAAVVNGTYPFFTCGQEILRTNTFSFDEEVVLLGGNNASAIYPVFYFKGKFDAYQRTYIIKPKPEVYISFKYLYFYWESKLDHLKNISTGAATKFLTLKILNDMDISLPEAKVMKEYEKLTEPIFKLKAILSEQNAKLREARDILLPRLMSGEIKV